MSVNTVVVIGCGRMAQYHLGHILQMRDSTKVKALVEPSKEMIERTSKIFSKFHIPLPPVYSSLNKFLQSGPKTETAFIITPHNVHFSQAKACLEAGDHDIFIFRRNTPEAVLVAYERYENMKNQLEELKDLLEDVAIYEIVEQRKKSPAKKISLDHLKKK